MFYITTCKSDCQPLNNVLNCTFFHFPSVFFVFSYTTGFFRISAAFGPFPVNSPQNTRAQKYIILPQKHKETEQSVRLLCDSFCSVFRHSACFLCSVSGGIIAALSAPGICNNITFLEAFHFQHYFLKQFFHKKPPHFPSRMI